MKKDFGCAEYNDLSRRQFLVGTGKFALAAGAITSLLPTVAMAQSGTTNRDTVLSVYLRGGCDGLSLCVPHGEDAYYSYRPTIAIPRPDSMDQGRAIDLNGFFGISPAMSLLMEAYTAGHLLFVHATGMMGSSRSHFDNQRWTETGVIETVPLGSGWLGRQLATTAAVRPGNTMRGVSLGQAIPLTLAGGPGTSAVSDVSSYGIDGSRVQQIERTAVLGTAYAADRNHLLSTSAQAILDTIALLKKIDFDRYSPMGGAVYPNSELGFAFKSAAALIRSDVGVEAMTIDFGGWDTHAGEGTNGGWMYRLMQDLAGSMAAFHRDLVAANKMNRSLVTVMSEFGRTAHENASAGTDHGSAGAMMVMGGGVAGGKVLSQWPGMRAANLTDGQDLKITIDYRDILAELVSKRLDNNSNLATIFPDYKPTFRGVTVA